jgi:transcriptional regulator with GAF, ATPase, and Fis domain
LYGGKPLGLYLQWGELAVSRLWGVETFLADPRRGKGQRAERREQKVQGIEAERGIHHHEEDPTRGRAMEPTVIDAYFYALSRVIDAIYRDDETLDDILFFIVSLAAELTGAKGSTIRVLDQGTFDLKVLSSYGLSQEYLDSGAIDRGKSITEILRGDIIIINDFEADSRVEDPDAAEREGVKAVIGLPFTVNETTYSILRVYFPAKKVPTHEEIELLRSLGRLSCLAIDRAVLSRMQTTS